jgi:di/tricarboxylate transporter
MKDRNTKLPICGILILVILASSMPNGKTNNTKFSGNTLNSITNAFIKIPLMPGCIKKVYLSNAGENTFGSMIAAQSEHAVHPFLPVSLFGIGLFVAMSFGWIRRKSEVNLEFPEAL